MLTKNLLLVLIKSFVFVYFSIVSILYSIEYRISHKDISFKSISQLSISTDNIVSFKKGTSGWKKISKIEKVTKNAQLENDAYSLDKISYYEQKAIHPEATETKKELLFSFKYKGIYSSLDFGKSWSKENYTLKREVFFDDKAERRITSIGNNHQFLLHKHDILFIKEDGSVIRLKHNLKSSEYLTAIAYHQNTIYVGSSVNGLYKANYKNETETLIFHSFSEGLPFIPHSKNVNFYEDIQTIHITEDNDIWVGNSLGSGVFVRYANSSLFEKIDLGNYPLNNIYQISSSNHHKIIWISSSDGLFVLEGKDSLYSITYHSIEALIQKAPKKTAILLLKENTKSLLAWFKIGKETTTISFKKERIEKADNRRLFYTSGFNWSQKKPKINSMLEGDIYNGIVLDIKDDTGYIQYATQIPFAKEIHSIRSLYNIKEIIHKVHEKSKWFVARIVIFKDPILYNIPGFAILNKETNTPWIGTPSERWIDPYNPILATKYYIPLIQELQELGVDEIQLDYIRFPSDGPVWNTKFSHKPSPSIYPSEGLENFLFQIRNSTHLPISLDIYGYNGLYKAPGLIGQDVEVYGYHADIIAPMLYSSHFGDWYMSDGIKEDRAYNLLALCAKRYQYFAHNNYLVRPWLQAFDMKTGIWGYGEDYIVDQVRGILKHKSHGFMFWGNINQMLMAEKAIKKENLPLIR